MSVVVLLICFAASTVGAIAGFGGGVIIKPLFDFLGILPVATTSFLSSCTVLSMTIVSLIRTRGNEINLDTHVATPLALGSVLGGVVGKVLFEIVCDSVTDESVLGSIQSICLLIILILVFLYICKRGKIRSFKVKNAPLSALIGLFLGMISSFLGIGGGPYNVAVLFLFYSMDAKTAAKNSLYIIFYSQLASILLSVFKHSVPDFELSVLVLMVVGGISGALVGAACSRRMSNRNVDYLLRILVIGIIGITIYNMVRFAVCCYGR